MREFRQDSHTFPLVLWTLLMMGSALLLLHHAGSRATAVVAGAGLLFVAPIAFAVYLYRARRVWVGVDPARGLVVSGRRAIPWEEITWVERRRPRLRSTSGPVEVKSFDAPGCEGLGLELGGLGTALFLIVAAFFVFWLIFFVFIPLLVVPLLEVFAPFGERIRILTRSGRPLVLRDLRGADDFMAALPRAVRAVTK